MADRAPLHRHTAFGLLIDCAVPLPGLMASSATGVPDLVVHLAPPPPSIRDGARTLRFASERDDPAPPALQVWAVGGSDALTFEYSEGIRFHVAADVGSIWSDWDAPLTIADTMTFLVGPILGFVLRQRGVVALHASAPVIDGRAVGLVGPGGAGKSTLAAACAQRGHPLLGDDVLALREREGAWEALPAVGEVRLWGESERLLFGEGSALPALTPTWPKRGLALEAQGFRFQREPAPLALLLLLEERRGAGPAAATPVRGADAIMGLVGNSYTNYLLDAAGRAVELQAIGRLVVQVPTWRFSASEGPGQLEATVRVIEELARRT